MAAVDANTTATDTARRVLPFTAPPKCVKFHLPELFRRVSSNSKNPRVSNKRAIPVPAPPALHPAHVDLFTALEVGGPPHLSTDSGPNLRHLPGRIPLTMIKSLDAFWHQRPQTQTIPDGRRQRGERCNCRPVRSFDRTPIAGVRRESRGVVPDRHLWISRAARAKAWDLTPQ